MASSFCFLMAESISLSSESTNSARSPSRSAIFPLATCTKFSGAVIFWLGLKMETDWPEGIGAFMITSAVTWGEFIVGWSKFDLGGIFVLPYLIPILTFAILMIYAMKRSV